jgi:glycosyltransferase involved in cell wall biosynthesis
MSRLAIVVSNPCIADARVIKMIDAAISGGHEVHVFATLGGGAPAYIVQNGVTYHRIEWKPIEYLKRKFLFKTFSLLSPKWFFLWLMKKVVDYCKYEIFSELFAEIISSVSPELIHAHDLICLPAAHAAADKCGAKVVYDAHELEMHRNPPLPLLRRLWVGYIEKKFSQKSAAVITVGERVKRVLSSHIGRNDIDVIFNAPVRNSSPSSVRKDLVLNDDVPLIIYVGKVTQGRGVGDVLSLLPKIPGVYFAAIGPTDSKTEAALRVLANRLDVSDRFRILPPVPHDQVVSYISGATLGIISVEPVTLSYRYCMPNKLFELAFAGVPIFSNELDDVRDFVNNLAIGVVFDFSKTQQLPSEIQRMIINRNSFSLSLEKREILESVYSWDSQALKLNEIYRSLV